MKSTHKLLPIVLLPLVFAACSKPSTEITTDPQESVLDTAAFVEQYQQEQMANNLSQVIRSIINGDYEALASVTNFPIWRPYPEKEITNAQELKSQFHILFDDSIRRDLRNYTTEDWELMGWRGFMLNNGQYLWADEDGHLSYINYESSKLTAYREQLRKEEYQMLNELPGWTTGDCLVAVDSSVFLRLEEMDGVERLHIFTHDVNPYRQHLVFNGTMESQGTCHNDVYWYACADGLITVWINSPTCLDSEINYGIAFPDSWDIPENLRDSTFACEKAFWRDVKKWW